jgi:methionyl-tRNA synthetase
VKEDTSFEEFEKTDIRVGTVTACSKVKKSNRLLQLTIDDGMGGRTILSGIAQSYPDPEVLVGKQVCFIANFPPRKMMGMESQGMVLSAVDADGHLVVVGPTATVAAGASVG